MTRVMHYYGSTLPNVMPPIRPWKIKKFRAFLNRIENGEYIASVGLKSSYLHGDLNKDKYRINVGGGGGCNSNLPAREISPLTRKKRKYLRLSGRPFSFQGEAGERNLD